MMVVGIVGLPASGKGEFSRVAREMGIHVVVMGDVIRQAVLAAGEAPTDEHLGRMGNHLRAERGMDAIAQACIPLIEQQEAPLVVVDGIRGESEVLAFRQHFEQFRLVCIKASFPTRLRRLQERKRSDDLHLAEDLLERDKREISWGLGEAMEGAEYILENEGDLRTFRARAEALLNVFIQECE